MGSTLTGTYGAEEAATFCELGHWRTEMGPDATMETFRTCMEKATDCPDFKERELTLRKDMYLEDIAHKRENYKMDLWSFAP